MGEARRSTGTAECAEVLAQMKAVYHETTCSSDIYGMHLDS